MDPQDLQSGPKGYLCCNIAVCGRGEVLKVRQIRRCFFPMNKMNNHSGIIFVVFVVVVRHLRNQRKIPTRPTLKRKIYVDIVLVVAVAVVKTVSGHCEPSTRVTSICVLTS